jgi:hypothetical protein
VALNSLLECEMRCFGFCGDFVGHLLHRSGCCYAPAATEGPAARDGLEPAAVSDGESDRKTRRKAPRKHEIIVGPFDAITRAQPQAKQRWEAGSIPRSCS